MRTSILEGTHITLEAFPAITSILDRIRKRDGCLGAQQDWYNENCPLHPCVYIMLSRGTCLMNIPQRILSIRIQSVPSEGRC